MSRNRRNHNVDPSLSGEIPIGSSVSVVKKEDQPTGRLTRGIVSEILTNGAHPRGVKVRLRDGTVGRVQRVDGALGPSSTVIAEEDMVFLTPTPNHQPVTWVSRPPRGRVVAPIPSPVVVAEEEGPSEVQWPCAACTMLNSGLMPMCEMCGTER